MNPNPMYFLLGHGANTCLVIAHQPGQGIQTFLSGAFQQIRSLYPFGMAVSTTWPTPDTLERIVSASTISQAVFDQPHLPSLGRAIVAYVGHPEYAEPVARLNRVLEILALHKDQAMVLNHLRRQSASDIPEDIQGSLATFLSFLSCHIVNTRQRAILVKEVSIFFYEKEDQVEGILKRANLILSRQPLPFPVGTVVDLDLPNLFEYCLGDDTRASRRILGDSSLPGIEHGPISPETWLGTSIRYIDWCNILSESSASKGVLHDFVPARRASLDYPRFMPLRASRA